MDTDYTYNPYSPSLTTPRRLVSHFGVALTRPGEWRFNIVHLDGHVDDSIWQENRPQWSFAFNIHSQNLRPYGWPWKTEVGQGSSQFGDGIVEEPYFKGAFDDNP